MNKLLLVIGILFLLAGIVANVFTQTTTEKHLWGLYSTSTTSTPYSNLMVPLLIGGIVLILVAVFVPGKKIAKK